MIKQLKNLLAIALLGALMIPVLRAEQYPMDCTSEIPTTLIYSREEASDETRNGTTLEHSYSHEATWYHDRVANLTSSYWSLIFNGRRDEVHNVQPAYFGWKTDFVNIWSMLGANGEQLYKVSHKYIIDGVQYGGRTGYITYGYQSALSVGAICNWKSPGNYLGEADFTSTLGDGRTLNQQRYGAEYWRFDCTQISMSWALDLYAWGNDLLNGQGYVMFDHRGLTSGAVNYKFIGDDCIGNYSDPCFQITKQPK